VYGSVGEQLRRAVSASLQRQLRWLTLDSPTSAAAPLRAARRALDQADLPLALRQFDRAWRCSREQTPTLASLYAQLLYLEGSDDHAALHLLRHAGRLGPDPDLSALKSLLLGRLRLLDEARGELQAALLSLCAVPGGLLSLAATALIDGPICNTPGWVGWGPDLSLVGAFCVGESFDTVEVDFGQGPVTHLLRPEMRTDPRTFRLQLEPPAEGVSVKISSRGTALLGSGLQTPRAFHWDARASGRERSLSGWARLGWNPHRPLRLRAEDEYGAHALIKTSGAPQPGWRWPFELRLPVTDLRGHSISLSGRLPDGRWEPFPDGPLLLASAVRRPGLRRALRVRRTARRHDTAQRRAKPTRYTDVVIPVHGNRTEALACIGSVLSTLDTRTRVVVIDDASADPALAKALTALAKAGRIVLLRNAHNLGYAASVNRAIALHRRRDVVLLNSDTRVFSGWLARLRAAAYSAPKIGTVTPLTNHGSVASYPKLSSAAMDPKSGRALQTLCASTHAGLSADIPVGVGFCMFVRRDCLDAVGALDQEVFGSGYGEEVDFCLRARARGWSHRLAADTFVYHAGGASFGTRRAALLDRSQRLLNLRYPGYDRAIEHFLRRDPLHGMRRALDEARLRALGGRVVLLVTLALPGGVNRLVAERCHALRAAGQLPLLLRPKKAGDFRHCELWTDAAELPNLRYDIPSELSALRALLSSLPLAGIELHHFLHLDARLIEVIRALRVPYDVFVHDYSWICPRITLIDGSGHYCGEPEIQVCDACVRRHGTNLGRSIGVGKLRARSTQWLRGARRVTAPSHDTALRFERYFPGLQIAVQPLSTPIEPSRSIATVPGVRGSRRVRVALVGTICEHKGYRILLACARDAATRDLPLEFVVVGSSERDPPLLATGRVFITGPYAEAEAPHLLKRERPDVGWCASVWPETWCYTLDYLLEAGVPVLGFDVGAIAERLRTAKRCELMPLQLVPRDINDRLLRLAMDGDGEPVTQSIRPSSEIKPMPQEPEQPSLETAPDAAGLSASIQVLPLPPGLYLFSVQSGRSAASPRGDEPLSLPAIHIGLGPGVRAEQVEFMAGPNTEGAWLFAVGDLLITRVRSPGATLVMSSVRAPGGDFLSIKVERLEARLEAAAGATALAPSTAAAVTGAADQQTASESGSVPANGSLLPIEVTAHVRSRGDMRFADGSWAGRIAPGLWIESFAIQPLRQFAAHDVEYKGLTGSGFETPWVSDAKMCGTKGMSVPLVGFAVRLKSGSATAGYDCEYSGHFQSGATIGPLRNGAPCRSAVANDPLEGIQLHFTKRTPAVTATEAVTSSVAADAKPRGNDKSKGAEASPPRVRASRRS
jgi:GT2 family glycosyltransferase